VLRYRPSLTVSILAFLGLLLVSAWLLFSLLAFKTAANDLYAQKGEHARTLLKAFVSLLPETIPTYPEGFIPPDSLASRYVQKLSEESTFSRLTLVDGNGNVIFTSGKDDNDVFTPFLNLSKSAEGSYVRPDGSGIVHLINISRNGVEVGKAGLLLSLAPEKARLSRSRQMLITYFVLDFILLFGCGSFVLSRIVVNPINKLVLATERITGGQYGFKLNVSGSAELAKLSVAFNEMALALRDKDAQVTEQLSALEKANAELFQAREEAIRSEKMASIGLLAAGMAHEIGTPLASIMGYAELVVGEQTDSAAVQDYARRISESCGRIDRIIRGLLDYSRPRPLSDNNTDVQDVLRETCSMLAHQGLFKQLQLELKLEEDPLFARCDHHQLQQIVINLLLNSRDATPQGGTIKVSAYHELAFAKIEISDNGSGISEDAMKHIFDPFFTTKAPGKGTGLGLAISARIVEGFGGRITVTSEVDQGSSFIIWLPLT
jgi:signal transduction histidine kinase